MKIITTKKALVFGILFMSITIAFINLTGNAVGQKVESAQANPMANVLSTSHIVRTIHVVSSNAQGYAPDVIHVKYRETVKLIVSTADDAHSFTMPGYNINQMIYPGKSTEIIFHATKKGTFTFFCNVPCPMVRNFGTITVS